MPGDEKMACQRDTGKVKRIATMLHKEAAITRGHAASFNLASFVADATTAAARLLA